MMSTDEFSITTLEASEYEVADEFLDELRLSGVTDDFIAKLSPPVHTLPYEGAWAVKVEGSSRLETILESRSEAELRGRELAQQRGAEHVVHGADGRILERNTYGNGRS